MNMDNKSLLEQYLSETAKVNKCSNANFGSEITLLPDAIKNLDANISKKNDFLSNIRVVDVPIADGVKLVTNSRSRAFANEKSPGPEPIHYTEDDAIDKVVCIGSRYFTDFKISKIEKYINYAGFAEHVKEQVTEDIISQRLAIAFNGIKCEPHTKEEARKFAALKKANIGWLQHIRNANINYFSSAEININKSDISNNIYRNMTELVLQAMSQLQQHSGVTKSLKMFMNPNLLHEYYRSLTGRINGVADDGIVEDKVMKQEFNGIPVVTEYTIPEGSILITSYDNLQLYRLVNSTAKIITQDQTNDIAQHVLRSHEAFVVARPNNAVLFDNVKISMKQDNNKSNKP